MPRPTVVLIEDDEAVAHELSRALFALGLAPRTYTGWRAASEALEGLDTGMWPDAMIVDLDLPHVPGTILSQTLIQRGSNLMGLSELNSLAEQRRYSMSPEAGSGR